MENNIKEIMYRVLHVIAVYIMGIDSFQLAISLHICLEKYAMYTEQINGEKYLSEHSRQWPFTLR